MPLAEPTPQDITVPTRISWCVLSGINIFNIILTSRRRCVTWECVLQASAVWLLWFIVSGYFNEQSPVPTILCSQCLRSECKQNSSNSTTASYWLTSRGYIFRAVHTMPLYCNGSMLRHNGRFGIVGAFWTTLLFRLVTCLVSLHALHTYSEWSINKLLIIMALYTRLKPRKLA